MFSNVEYSYHSGIPKKYYHLKDKVFTEWEIPPWEVYIDVNNKLGEGQFGSVYLAHWRKTPVAIKIVHEHLPKDKKQLFLREFDAMTKMHHPNIVQFLGYLDSPFSVIMEYITHGDLYSYINSRSVSISDKLSLSIDILRGINYMHSRKPQYVIHRDIKPSNILVSNSGKAKITDFGLCRLLDKQPSVLDLTSMDTSLDDDMTSNVGTTRYMAPELFDSIAQYNYKVDIWSCGAVFFELFEESKFVKGAHFIHTPPPIHNLVSFHMLCSNPLNRDTADSLIDKFSSVVLPKKYFYNLYACFH